MSRGEGGGGGTATPELLAKRARTKQPVAEEPWVLPHNTPSRGHT